MFYAHKEKGSQNSLKAFVFVAKTGVEPVTSGL